MRFLHKDPKDVDQVISLKEMLKHLKWWLKRCPLLDDFPHSYSGMMGESEYECSICGRKYYEEPDEWEIEKSEALNKILENFDWESTKKTP